MSIIAFDPGTKRIGVAVSESGIIATAVGYIKNGDNTGNEIIKLLNKYNPEKIIVGRPLNMDGTKSRTAGFADELEKKLRVLAGGAEVIPWDERLTSKQAESILIEGDMSRKKRKQTVDKVAAAIILQNYIDSSKAKNNGKQ
jgi:putative holliday junction resolvase